LITRSTHLALWGSGIGQPGVVFGRPLRLQLALDLAAVLLAAATFGQAAHPDVLLHVVWVVLAVDAFAFGLRVSAIRIAIATVVVFGYSWFAGQTREVWHWTSPLAPLDVEEWPLMVVISVVVAVAAERLHTVSQRYAFLYRQASSRLLTAQEDERRRLARDLHDGVGQSITALALTLDAAESMLWAGNDAPSAMTRSAIKRAQELAAVALDEARGVAFRLRPPRLQEAGLVAAIRELAVASGTNTVTTADAQLARPGLFPIDTEVELFRMVQEALANSIRHGRAKRRWISAELVGTRLVLEMGDDGAGFDQAGVTGRGLGLAGMHERAAAIGADLAIHSAPGRGTRIVIEVDVPTPGTADGGISHHPSPVNA
jgi:signal transduction histidine kinase